MSLFHAAMRDVSPLPVSDKIARQNPTTPPLPHKHHRHDEPSQDKLSDHIAVTIDAGDAWSYTQPGVSHQTLRRLRRGYWKIQEDLDLHGFTRDHARQQLNNFLDVCALKKFRCIRIIHGKGLSSKDREPVLKTRIGNWLMQRPDVLAFCQAKPEDGGGGALLILLKTSA